MSACCRRGPRRIRAAPSPAPSSPPSAAAASAFRPPWAARPSAFRSSSSSAAWRRSRGRLGLRRFGAVVVAAAGRWAVGRSAAPLRRRRCGGVVAGGAVAMAQSRPPPAAACPSRPRLAPASAPPCRSSARAFCRSASVFSSSTRCAPALPCSALSRATASSAGAAPPLPCPASRDTLSWSRPGTAAGRLFLDRGADPAAAARAGTATFGGRRGGGDAIAVRAPVGRLHADDLRRFGRLSRRRRRPRSESSRSRRCAGGSCCCRRMRWHCP